MSSSTVAEFDVKILANNDKLTHLYTGLPMYSSFVALVDYFEKAMVAWIKLNNLVLMKTFLISIFPWHICD